MGHEMKQDDAQHGGDRFPPTRWSVIEAVRSIDAEERERALESLCAAYWKPVYKYVRLRWNRPADDAQDLTQGFFMELLERELLDKFDSKKSRLRTYLRLCVDSFVMNQNKAATPPKARWKRVARSAGFFRCGRGIGWGRHGSRFHSFARIARRLF